MAAKRKKSFDTWFKQVQDYMATRWYLDRTETGYVKDWFKTSFDYGLSPQEAGDKYAEKYDLIEPSDWGLGGLAASGCTPGTAFGGLVDGGKAAGAAMYGLGNEPVRAKVGREVLDPMGRRVTIVAVNGSMVTVKMGGYMGITAQYPITSLRNVP